MLGEKFKQLKQFPEDEDKNENQTERTENKQEKHVTLDKSGQAYAGENILWDVDKNGEIFKSKVGEVKDSSTFISAYGNELSFNNFYVNENKAKAEAQRIRDTFVEQLTADCQDEKNHTFSKGETVYWVDEWTVGKTANERVLKRVIGSINPASQMYQYQEYWYYLENLYINKENAITAAQKIIAEEAQKKQEEVSTQPPVNEERPSGQTEGPPDFWRVVEQVRNGNESALSPEQRQRSEHLQELFEGEEYEAEKKKHDPIRRFWLERGLSEEEIDQLNFQYHFIHRTEQESDGTLSAGNPMTVTNYHDFVRSRAQMSDEEKDEADIKWRDSSGDVWQSPTVTAKKIGEVNFWDRLNDQGDLGEYEGDYNQLDKSLMASQESDTYAEQAGRQAALLQLVIDRYVDEYPGIEEAIFEHKNIRDGVLAIMSEGGDPDTTEKKLIAHFEQAQTIIIFADALKEYQRLIDNFTSEDAWGQVLEFLADKGLDEAAFRRYAEEILGTEDLPSADKKARAIQYLVKEYKILSLGGDPDFRVPMKASEEFLLAESTRETLQRSGLTMTELIRVLQEENLPVSKKVLRELEKQNGNKLNIQQIKEKAGAFGKRVYATGKNVSAGAYQLGKTAVEMIPEPIRKKANKALERAANWGSKLEEVKDKKFAAMFSWLGKRADYQWTTFIKGTIDKMAEDYENKAEREQQFQQMPTRSKSQNALGAMKIFGNIAKLGGFLLLPASRLYRGVMGATFVATEGMTAAKLQRFENDRLKLDEREAEEEAWELYEKAGIGKKFDNMVMLRPQEDRYGRIIENDLILIDWLGRDREITLQELEEVEQDAALDVEQKAEKRKDIRQAAQERRKQKMEEKDRGDYWAAYGDDDQKAEELLQVSRWFTVHSGLTDEEVTRTVESDNTITPEIQTAIKQEVINRKTRDADRQALNQAYYDALPQTLQKRLERGWQKNEVIGADENAAGVSLWSKGMEKIAKAIQKKDVQAVAQAWQLMIQSTIVWRLRWVDENIKEVEASDFSEEEKKNKIERWHWWNDTFLKDMDGMMGAAGTLDTLAFGIKSLETTGKAASAAFIATSYAHLASLGWQVVTHPVDTIGRGWNSASSLLRSLQSAKNSGGVSGGWEAPTNTPEPTSTPIEPTATPEASATPIASSTPTNTPESIATFTPSQTPVESIPAGGNIDDTTSELTIDPTATPTEAVKEPTATPPPTETAVPSPTAEPTIESSDRGTSQEISDATEIIEPTATKAQSAPESVESASDVEKADVDEVSRESTKEQGSLEGEKKSITEQTQLASSEKSSAIKRIPWHGQDVSHGLGWGGKEGTGIDKDGNYVVSIRGMLKDQQVKALYDTGKLQLRLTPPDGGDVQVIPIIAGHNGLINVGKTGATDSVFFSHDEKGVVPRMKFMEVTTLPAEGSNQVEVLASFDNPEITEEVKAPEIPAKHELAGESVWSQAEKNMESYVREKNLAKGLDGRQTRALIVHHTDMIEDALRDIVNENKDLGSIANASARKQFGLEGITNIDSIQPEQLADIKWEEIIKALDEQEKAFTSSAELGDDKLDSIAKNLEQTATAQSAAVEKSVTLPESESSQDADSAQKPFSPQWQQKQAEAWANVPNTEKLTDNGVLVSPEAFGKAVGLPFEPALGPEEPNTDRVKDLILGGITDTAEGKKIVGLHESYKLPIGDIIQHRALAQTLDANFGKDDQKFISGYLNMLPYKNVGRSLDIGKFMQSLGLPLSEDMTGLVTPSVSSPASASEAATFTYQNKYGHTSYAVTVTGKDIVIKDLAGDQGSRRWPLTRLKDMLADPAQAFAEGSTVMPPDNFSQTKSPDKSATSPYRQYVPKSTGGVVEKSSAIKTSPTPTTRSAAPVAQAPAPVTPAPAVEEQKLPVETTEVTKPEEETKLPPKESDSSTDSGVSTEAGESAETPDSDDSSDDSSDEQSAPEKGRVDKELEKIAQEHSLSEGDQQAMQKLAEEVGVSSDRLEYIPSVLHPMLGQAEREAILRLLEDNSHAGAKAELLSWIDKAVGVTDVLVTPGDSQALEIVFKDATQTKYTVILPPAESGRDVLVSDGALGSGNSYLLEQGQNLKDFLKRMSASFELELPDPPAIIK